MFIKMHKVLGVSMTRDENTRWQILHFWMRLDLGKILAPFLGRSLGAAHNIKFLKTSSAAGPGGRAFKNACYTITALWRYIFLP